jgi:hypothetical protein
VHQGWTSSQPGLLIVLLDVLPSSVPSGGGETQGARNCFRVLAAAMLPCCLERPLSAGSARGLLKVEILLHPHAQPTLCRTWAAAHRSRASVWMPCKVRRASSAASARDSARRCATSMRTRSSVNQHRIMGVSGSLTWHIHGTNNQPSTHQRAAAAATAYQQQSVQVRRWTTAAAGEPSVEARRWVQGSREHLQCQIPSLLRAHKSPWVVVAAWRWVSTVHLSPANLMSGQHVTQPPRVLGAVQQAARCMA